VSCDRGQQDEPAAHTVGLGDRVRVRDVDGDHEHTVVDRGADVARGLISADSPVGRALLGRRCGEEVTVQTPGGVRRLTIVHVAAPAGTAKREPVSPSEPEGDAPAGTASPVHALECAAS
jgi:transcription elongation factor GreA